MSYPWKSELPALSELSDQEAADAINALTIEVLEPITSAELLAWSAVAGRFAKLDAATESENADVRSLANAAKLLLMRDGTVLDLSLSDRAAMVDALVSVGVLTVEDKASLYGLATVTRAKYPRVREGEIQMARAGQ
jgi:hypothetical protein